MNSRKFRSTKTNTPPQHISNSSRDTPTWCLQSMYQAVACMSLQNAVYPRPHRGGGWPIPRPSTGGRPQDPACLRANAESGDSFLRKIVHVTVRYVFSRHHVATQRALLAL